MLNKELRYMQLRYIYYAWFCLYVIGLSWFGLPVLDFRKRPSPVGDHFLLARGLSLKTISTRNFYTNDLISTIFYQVLVEIPGCFVPFSLLWIVPSWKSIFHHSWISYSINIRCQYFPQGDC